MGRRRKRSKRSIAPAAVPERPAPARPSSGKWKVVAVVVLIVGGIVAWRSLGGPGFGVKRSKAPVYGYRVVNTYPHDAEAFCQGLLYADGALYEGTGEYGKSSLRKIELTTGKLLASVPLARNLFGEGIARVGSEILQLSWKSELGIAYELETLRELRRFHYEGEGWGLTFDGEHLIMSDGTATLQFLDPKSLQVVRSVTVRDGGMPVDQLNELEFVQGEIFANLWHSDRVVRISPESGNVAGYLDLAGLWPRHQRPDDQAVLNGIAYDEQGDRLFVTGKNWPQLFEIRIVPR